MRSSLTFGADLVVISGLMGTNTYNTESMVNIDKSLSAFILSSISSNDSLRIEELIVFISNQPDL